MNGIQKKLVPIILAMAMIFSTCFSNLGTIVYADREQTVTTLEQLSELPPECSEDEEHCALNLLQQVTDPLSQTEETIASEEEATEEVVLEEGEETSTEEEELVTEEEELVTEEEELVTEEEEPVTEEEAPVTEEEERVTEEEEPVTEEEEPVTEEEEEPVTEEEERVTEEEERVTEEEESVTEEEESVTEEEEPVTEEEERVTEEEEPVTEEQEALIEDDTNSSNNVYNSSMKIDYNLRSISEYIATGSKATDRSWSDGSYNYSALVDSDTSNTYPFFSTSSGTSNPSNNDGRVWVDKSVTLGDNNGEFDVMLSALAQEYTVENAVPANVVFILDISWSMVDKNSTRGMDAVNAINNAIRTLLNKAPNTKVGVVTFNGPNPNGGKPISPDTYSSELLPLGTYKVSDYPYLEYYKYPDTEKKDYYVVRTKPLSKNKEVRFYGGTYTQAGIQRGAQQLINAASQDRNRLPVLILLSDGKPTFVYGGAGVASGTVGDSTAGNAKEADIVGEWGYWPIQTARAKKTAITSEYNYPALFYTVGLGITDPFGKTVLNPNKNNIQSLSSTTQPQKKLRELLTKEGDIPSYANYAASGNMSASELNQIFQQMAANTSKIPYSPFATSSNNAAITFTDVIGEGMEIKGAKEKGKKITVRYGTNNYEFVNDGSGNYKNTTQSVTDDYGNSISLSNLEIKVTETSGVQTLTWSIPKGLVPVYRYVTTNTAGTIIYDPALPIRLIYTVGLKSDATNGVNTATYYTNAMTSSKDALTKAEFTLAANNKYYQNYTPQTIAKKDTSNNVVNITGTASYVSLENKNGQSMTVKLGNNGRLDVVKNVSKTVTKSWEDFDNVYEIRPETITVQLLQNNQVIEQAELTANSEQPWTYTWEGLPEFDSSGQRYTYTVTEEAVSGYEASYNQDSLTVTNTLKTVSKTVTKSWEDSDNVYEIRPETITVQLLQNNQVIKTAELTANSEQPWTYTWEGLPEFDSSGQRYMYTVTEEAVPGYEASYDQASLTVTNTLKRVSRTVTKSWEDSDNVYEIRPETITVKLLQNNQVIETAELTANSEQPWTYTWEGLPEFDSSGQRYTYTVTEEAVPGYVSSINQNTLQITNTLIKGSITINKKGENETSLDGVVFKLEKQHSNGWSIVSDSLITDSGSVTLNNLLIGRYRLTEIKTNDGYKLLDSVIEFDIPYNEANAKLPNGVAIVGNNQNSSSPQLTITVTNYENIKLPDTGGEGVIGYVIGGSCLVGLSAVLYSRQVRRKNVSRN